MSTFVDYTSVKANGVTNVAHAAGDVAGEITPHGVGVGLPFIVSVAAGDTSLSLE